MKFNKEGILWITRIFMAMFVMLAHSSCTPPEQKILLADIGVCTRFDNAEMLAALGYTFIEESVGNLLVPAKTEEEFNEILSRAKQSPLPIRACNSFIPGSMKSVGPDAVHPGILEYMETALRRAQMIGVEYIVFGSGGSRSIPEGFPREEARAQFISLLRDMAPIAEKYNVVVVLEPLNQRETNFINSVSEGGEIVEAVGHPNFRLLADIYHMMMDDEGPGSIIKYGHLIHHTHIAEKEGRAAPGTHNEDFRAYFEALKKIGYKGMMSVECRWENMETQAGLALQTIREQLSTLAF